MRCIKKRAETPIWFLQRVCLASLLAASTALAGEIPSLIQLQTSEVQQAWSEVQASIEENAKQSQPMPEPYFARAEIWSLVNNHDAAMRDYLQAARLSIEAGQSLETQASYFNKLYEALDNLDRAPRARVVGLGKKHYARGVHAFWQGDFGTALSELDNAVSLEPTEPLHWYFRALTYKRLNRNRRAQHDALMGAHLEQSADDNQRVGTALTRVQGKLRLWLEAYRRDAPDRVVGLRARKPS